jgi:ABC-type arginine/histidine transport system permease subunit
MTPTLGMFTFIFNLVGLVICIVGLTLAQRREKRWPGYALAVFGFFIAASPLWYQLFAGLQQ